MISFLKKWFRKILSKNMNEPGPVIVKPADPIPEVPTKEEVDNFPSKKPKKIAIIVGHGNGDPGAIAFNGMGEFSYNSFVAEEIEKNAKKNTVKIFYRGDTGIVGVAAKVVAWDPEVSIELHLNSYNGQAKGCEVLVLKGDDKSAELGRKFAKEYCRKFNRIMRRDQGINFISSNDRGYASLKALTPVGQAILVEPFFCDNPNEWVEPSIHASFLIDFVDSL